MKHLKSLLTIFILLGAISVHYAQYGYTRPMVAINSGNIADLKGISQVNILYDYSTMSVGAFKNEADYLKKKQEDYKNDPAKFEKFKHGWVSDRKARFEPKFEELFNKVGAKSGITGKNYASDAPITLKVQVLFTEPGYNVGISKMPAFVDFECTFVDKEGKELVRYLIKNAMGSQAMGMDFDTGSRLTESYAKGAKMLMKDVTKRLKKLK